MPSPLLKFSPLQVLRADSLALIGHAIEARLRVDLCEPAAACCALRTLADAAGDLADRLEQPGSAHLDDLPDLAGDVDDDLDDRAEADEAQLLDA